MTKRINIKKTYYKHKDTVHILDCIRLNTEENEHDYVPDMKADLEEAGYNVKIIPIESNEDLQRAIKEIGQSDHFINIILNAHGDEEFLYHAHGERGFSTYKEAFRKIKRLARHDNTEIRVMMPVCFSGKYLNKSNLTKNLNLTVLGFNNKVADYDATKAVVAFMKKVNNISHDYDTFAEVSATDENRAYFNDAVLIDYKTRRKIDGYQYSPRRPKNRKKKYYLYRGAEHSQKRLLMVRQLWIRIKQRLLNLCNYWNYWGS